MEENGTPYIIKIYERRFSLDLLSYRVYIDSYVDSNEKDLTSGYIIENKHNKYVEHRATFYHIMGFKDVAEMVIAQRK